MSADDDGVYTMPKQINSPTVFLSGPMLQVLPTILIPIPLSVTPIGLWSIPITVAYFLFVGWMYKSKSKGWFYHKIWRWGLGDYKVAGKKTTTVTNPMVKRYYS